MPRVLSGEVSQIFLPRQGFDLLGRQHRLTHFAIFNGEISCRFRINIFCQVWPMNEHGALPGSIPQANGHEPTIYDGLITKTVNLVQVKASKSITAAQLQSEISNQSKLDALKYRFPLKYLGQAYQNVVVPCTPAHQICLVRPGSVEPGFRYLVKKEGQGGLKGVASGKRSALLWENDRILRFKGCGNEYMGFNRENNQSRGHHFYHTSKRELFMTNYLNNLLQHKLGLDTPANRPLYAFRYSEDSLQEEQIVNQLPLISKYCAVFETQGDRRAGTHLISPIEILFLQLFDHQTFWEDKLKAAGRFEGGELMDFLIDYDLDVKPGERFIDSYRKTALLAYVNLEGSQKIQLASDYREKVHKIIQELVPAPFREKAASLFEGLVPEKLVTLFWAILNRIGMEMGLIKAAMCEQNISWGFYLDHGLLWHCNAHLNNFIVTRPRPGKQCAGFFLLPLDYDLAFRHEQFICIELDSPEYGQNSSTKFQQDLMGEFKAMEMSLFGLELMNFKYGLCEQGDLGAPKKTAKAVFRDTLVRSFHVGMRQPADQMDRLKQVWDQNIEQIQNLVELCLWLSVDFQT